MKTKHMREIMSSSYAPGDCHVCKQRKVKVKLLSCGKHNYCRMCAEFDPHIVGGNLTCKKCHSSQRKRNDKIGKFLTAHTESANETASTQVASDVKELFQNNEPDEENDLDGLNEEWDHLLQTIVTPSPTPPSPVPDKESGVTSGINNIGIPKKSSFLRLILPSATNNSSATSPSASTHLMPKNISELLSDKLGSAMASVPDNNIDPSDSSEEKPDCSQSRKHRTLASTITRRFTPDPKEEERGSSPCKGMRWRKTTSYRHCDSPVEHTDDRQQDEPPGNETSESEVTVNESNVFDHMSREIGDIEGPGFDSTSSSRSGSFTSLQDRALVFDSFWDA